MKSAFPPACLFRALLSNPGLACTVGCDLRQCAPGPNGQSSGIAGTETRTLSLGATSPFPSRIPQSPDSDTQRTRTVPGPTTVTVSGLLTESRPKAARAGVGLGLGVSESAAQRSGCHSDCLTGSATDVTATQNHSVTVTQLVTIQRLKHVQVRVTFESLESPFREDRDSDIHWQWLTHV